MSIDNLLNFEENYLGKGIRSIIVREARVGEDNQPYLISEDFGIDSEEFRKKVEYKLVCDLCMTWHSEDFQKEDLKKIPNFYELISLKEGDIIAHKTEKTYIAQVESISTCDPTKRLSDEEIAEMVKDFKPGTNLLFQRVLLSSTLPFAPIHFKQGQHWFRAGNIDGLKTEY